MFGFGASNNHTPKGDIFDVEDIRQLVLDFPPPNNGSEDDLIPLASGTGFTTKVALKKAFETLIHGQYGRIPFSAVEKKLDIQQALLLPIIRSRKGFMLSKSREEIVTACEQIRLVEELYNKAANTFTCASNFADEHNIDVQCIPYLLILADERPQSSPLQLLDAPGESTAKSLELGHSYIHTLSTLLSLKKAITGKAKRAHVDSKVATWSDSELLGLNAQTFSRLANTFLREANEFHNIDGVDGFFESGENEIRYVTKTYLLRKAKRVLKEVAMGTQPYCDLEQLAKEYSTLLPDVPAAKAFAEKECVHKDGTPYKWHFVSHYAIGDISLNNTAQRCHELIGPQRYLNTKPFVQAFPAEIQREMLMLLQDRFELVFRYCGGNTRDLLGIDEHLVLKAFTSDLEMAAERLGRASADKSWKDSIEVSSKSLTSPTETTSFLERLQEESDAPLDLLQKLWDDSRVGIQTKAVSAFNERIAELEAGNQTQLESLWKSRVMILIRLAEQAVETFQPGSTKEQLQDLLAIHISQDLIPSALKRIRTKGLARSPHTLKQVERLQAAIGGEKKGGSILKDLNKFNDKMGFTAPSEEDLSQARNQQLREMVGAMEKDSDGPRLFLATVVVLLMSKQKEGLLYATGKFAPKLLKILKPSLEEEEFKTLERIKDAVKAGTVGDEDRKEMKELAAAALRKDVVPNRGDT